MSLEDQTWLILAVAVLPVPLTMVFFIVHSVVTGTPRAAYGLPMAYLIYGLANIVTVGGLYALLSGEEREAVFRFARPSVTELSWAVAAFVVGLGVYELTSRVSAVFGYELQGLSYSLTTPSTMAIIVIGAVVIAPITEEILYRGTHSRSVALSWIRGRECGGSHDGALRADSSPDLRGGGDDIYLCVGCPPGTHPPAV